AMNIARRRFLRLAAGATTLPAVSRIARAQAYPSRPVRLIVGFPAGGGADIVARILGRWLSERLGQEFIIENKPGANTSIAAQTALNAPPDGYTLLWCGISNAINASFYDNLPFDFAKDIAPVSGVGIYPLVLEVHPSVQAKTLAEFVALAKANPGKINLASYGTARSLTSAANCSRCERESTWFMCRFGAPRQCLRICLADKCKRPSIRWPPRFRIPDRGHCARSL